jgi:hypothetical protein
MKNLMYIIISSIMTLLTLIGFNEEFSRFMFASGSDSLMTLIESNNYIRVFLLLIFLSVLISKNRFVNRYLRFLILTVAFAAWILSGRMVAVFAYGQINIGWFYLFETKQIQLCGNQDCEYILNNETEYNRELIWSFRIKNKEVNTTFFVGPFISNQIDSTFFEKFKKFKNKKTI